MNTISKTEITATFTKTIGIWNNYLLHYTNTKKEKKVKAIEMHLVYRDSNPKDIILKFVGGPTGFEAYYVQDLLHPSTFPKPETFCICAGTINSWAKCTVSWKNVLDFLKENGFDLKNNN